MLVCCTDPKIKYLSWSAEKILNNQLEVWQHEWWQGNNCHAMSLQQAVGSGQHEVEVVAKKEKRQQSTGGVTT